MAPMILGLSAILPDGKLFSYVDKNNDLEPVTLKSGELNSNISTIKISDNKKIKKCRLPY